MEHSQHESRGLVGLVNLCTSYGFDVLAILVVLVAFDATMLSGGVPQALRAVVALPFVVFLPGYAITAALFPRTVDRFRTGERHTPFAAATDGALSPRERVVLSFGTSLAALPVLGVVHSLANLGFETPALVGTLSVVVLLGLGVGLVRRVRAPRRERVSFSPGAWPTEIKSRLIHESPVDTVLTLALVVAVLAATSGLSLALVAPNGGNSYTTTKLLTENETGDLVMDGYPTNLSSGESASVVLGVENHEGSRTSYTVVTELQSVREENGTLTVLRERELGRRNQTVPAGETWYHEQSVSPELSGDTQRVVFLVYRGDPPAEPRVANAYRPAQLTINASDG